MRKKVQEIVAYKTQKTVRLLTHRIGVTLAIIRFLRYYKSSFFPSSSLKFSPTAELRKIGRCDGMVDVADSKSAAGDSVPVRVRSPAPRAEDLRRRFSALFFERAKENPDIKIVVVWPGQYRSEAFLCDPTVALEKIR